MKKRTVLPFWEDFDKTFADMSGAFEQLFRTETTTPIMGYPPYDITVGDNNDIFIEIAVAGLEKSEIDIYVEGGTLHVKYEKPAVVEEEFDPTKTHTIEQVLETGKLHFIHKGIARRSFHLSWKLKPGVRVLEASMHNGILDIALIKEPVEPDRKTIEIQDPIVY